MSISFGAIQLREVTLTLDTSAYADGDVLADTQELTEFFNPFNRSVIIQSLQVLDESDQGVALDVLFMRDNTSIGTENAALNISDTDARDIMGIVSVVAGDFVDLVNSKQAFPQFNPIVIQNDDAAEHSLYVAAVSRGAGTYGATGIRLRIGYIVNSS